MDIAELQTQINQHVTLSFRDGEVVEAILLGVDPVEHRDLTYEVTKIVRHGTPRALGTEEGGTCVASIDDLATWERSGAS